MPILFGLLLFFIDFSIFPEPSPFFLFTVNMSFTYFHFFLPHSICCMSFTTFPLLHAFLYMRDPTFFLPQIVFISPASPLVIYDPVINLDALQSNKLVFSANICDFKSWRVLRNGASCLFVQAFAPTYIVELKHFMSIQWTIFKQKFL